MNAKDGITNILKTLIVLNAWKIVEKRILVSGRTLIALLDIMNKMQIIEISLGNKKIDLGLSSEGTIHFNLISKLSASGEIEITETRIVGVTEKHKYTFLHEVSNDVFPIEFYLSNRLEMNLPEGVPRNKPRMPIEAKLGLYKKLKEELEEKGLI